MPWISRAAISIPKVGASTDSTQPTAKRPYADQQRRPPAHDVGDGTVDELHQREADHVDVDEQLELVRLGHAEMGLNGREGRKHDVDRDGGHGHHQRDERHELGKARQSPRGRGVGRGGGGHGLRLP
jgi:hypothetical protein